MLKAHRISKYFPEKFGNEKPVSISDFSIELNYGECVGIMGHSGCGKSTLLRVLSGILKPDKGWVKIDSIDAAITPYPIAFVFQDPNLLPWRTVYKNVELSLRIVKSERKNQDVIRDLLAQVGLLETEWKYPHELSGGMQSRCSLARALAVRSRFLFMDEPFGNLDPGTRLELQIFIKKIITNESHCSILVTHSIEEAVFLCNRIFVFRDQCGGCLGKDFLCLSNPLSDNLLSPKNVVDTVEYISIRDNIIDFLSLD